MTAGRLDHNGRPIVEHRPRAGHGIRGDFLLDWQHDEGAYMDAPAWHPRGSTIGEFHRADAGRAWHFRTGHTSAPPAPPAVWPIYVTLRGIIYRVRMEPMTIGGAVSQFLTTTEVRPIVKRGRALRSTSRLYLEAERLAREHTLRSY